MDPLAWSVTLETLFRRGQRMIPWRSGQSGSWSLNDKFEDIYLDEFTRDKVTTIKDYPTDSRSFMPPASQQNIELKWKKQSEKFQISPLHMKHPK
jgi:hypothetical protein